MNEDYSCTLYLLVCPINQSLKILNQMSGQVTILATSFVYQFFPLHIRRLISCLDHRTILLEMPIHIFFAVSF
jgi:hypothetical protein